MSAPGIPTAGLPVKARHALPRAGVQLRRVYSQSVPTGTLTTIAWDTVDEDTDGYYDPTGTSITVPGADGQGPSYSGVYAVTVQVAGAVTTRGFVDVIPVAAVTTNVAQFRRPIDPAEDRAALPLSVLLFGGDSFSVAVFHSTGSNVNFTAWLSAYRLGVHRWD
jgi:hypothetical protein